MEHITSTKQQLLINIFRRGWTAYYPHSTSFDMTVSHNDVKDSLRFVFILKGQGNIELKFRTEYDENIKSHKLITYFMETSIIDFDILVDVVNKIDNICKQKYDQIISCIN